MALRQMNDVHFIALIKGNDRYVFLYGDAQQAEIQETFGRFAADKTLSFTWYDSADLSLKVREMATANKEPRRW